MNFQNGLRNVLFPETALVLFIAGGNVLYTVSMVMTAGQIIVPISARQWPSNEGRPLSGPFS